MARRRTGHEFSVFARVRQDSYSETSGHSYDRPYGQLGRRAGVPRRDGLVDIYAVLQPSGNRPGPAHRCPNPGSCRHGDSDDGSRNPSARRGFDDRYAGYPCLGQGRRGMTAPLGAFMAWLAGERGAVRLHCRTHMDQRFPIVLDSNSRQVRPRQKNSAVRITRRQRLT